MQKFAHSQGIRGNTLKHASTTIGAGMVLLAALAQPAAAVTATPVTATFAGTTTACPLCVSKDASGLAAQASGHRLSTGWDVKSGANGLYLANGSGALFTLPGKTFDLTGLRLFGTARASSASVPITYTLVAFHPGIALADVVQTTVKARAVSNLTFTDPKLQNVEALYLRADAAIGSTYVIGLTYAPN